MFIKNWIYHSQNNQLLLYSKTLKEHSEKRQSMNEATVCNDDNVIYIDELFVIYKLFPIYIYKIHIAH